MCELNWTELTHSRHTERRPGKAYEYIDPPAGQADGTDKLIHKYALRYERDGSNPVAAYREELPRAAQWGTSRTCLEDMYVYSICLAYFAINQSDLKRLLAP